jgi:hypothetical protein
MGGERDGRGIEQRERGGNGRGEEAGKGEGKGWTPRGPGPPKIFGLEPPLEKAVAYRSLQDCVCIRHRRHSS